MNFPKNLLLKSQLLNLLELLAKHAAASKRKGVVGKRGRNMPRIASPKEMVPARVSSRFLKLHRVGLFRYFFIVLRPVVNLLHRYQWVSRSKGNSYSRCSYLKLGLR